MEIVRAVASLLFVGIGVTVCPAAEYHAAPGGQPQADGSAAHPWDLQTALYGHPDQQGRQQVQPGDTIWLDAGTYRGGFDCRVEGTEAAPVTVRAVPGARVTIDCRPRDDGRDSGLFTVQGAYTILWGLELTCSDPQRTTVKPGSWPEDIQRGGLFSRAHHTKLINLNLHDTANGVGFWAEGHGGEIYGCLIHHNGWKGPDRTHGHAIYAQNESGQKRLLDNIIFNQFSHGIHCYGSSKARLINFLVEGNACFSNGCYDDKAGPTPGIFIGGETPASQIVITHNYLYGGGLTCGYPWGKVNHDVAVTDNQIAAGGLTFRNFRTITCLRNTLIAPAMMVQFDNAEPVDWEGSKWNDNHYVRTSNEYQAFGRHDGERSRGFSFTEWREATGFDAASDYREGPSAGTKVFRRPN